MPETNQTNQKIKAIVSLLRKMHRSLLKKKVFSVIALMASLFFAGLVIITLVENGAFLSGALKSALFFLVIIFSLISGTLVLKWISIPRFPVFYEDFFRSTGRKNILSAVDLFLDEKQQRSRFYQAALSSNLESADISAISSELKHYSGDQKVSGVFRYSISGFLTALVLFIFISATLPGETIRALHFWSGYTQPNPFAYTITPADTTIEHGSSFEINIQFTGNRHPENVILDYKTDVEEGFRQRQMQFTENGTFISPEIDLINNITYRVEMDGFYSSEYSVNVQLQPRFDELIAVITPPEYTGLSQTRLEYPYSQINLYAGSAILFEGITNKPVESIRIGGQSIDHRMFSENGNSEKFSAEITPQQTDTIRFELVDKEGMKNRNPYRAVINLREDQYPVVVIQEPVGTVMKTEPEHIDIYYLATDDFGLTRAQLYWQHQRAFVEEAASGTVSLDRPRNGRNQQFRWNLSEFELRPRDQLIFSIRVWDNDEISGYKMSESQQVIIQIPSLTEYFDDLDSRERDMQGELDNISESFDHMEQEYEEFLERMRQNPEGGFEEEQMLEEIRERQEAMDEAVRNLNEKFNEMRSEIENNDRISEETRRAYQELQQLMDELDDPALREAMEELQRALENLSPQDLERALENMSFNEQLYKERLQRTVELFKRLKMNSDLDKLARQYEDLAERMLRDEDRQPEQISRELETVEQDLDNVSEQLDQLDNNPPARSEENLRNLKEEGQRELEHIREQLEQLKNDVRNSQLNGEQQENGEHSESGAQQGESGDSEEGGQNDGESSPSDPVRQQQQQIGQQMQAEAERFRASIQQMSGQQLNVNILALQRSLYTLLELSNMQEYLTRTADETRNRSQGYIELARIQKNVSDHFSAVADTLTRVSAELPGIPNQVNRKKLEVEQRLSRTMEQMVDRNQRGSTIATRESLGGINDLASMLASLLDQLMNQQNGGGAGGMSMQQMVQQLQNMSGNQQQLNQQLQDLINDVQGDRLTREQSERLDQMARQQNEIRRQLQEIRQGGALEQGDRLLSELQRMVEDMEESINDMRGGITDPLMVERQQNILSRMLNAEEAMQQRGEDEEREGTTRMEYERVLPPDITLEELQQEIRARMQDPNFTRFSEQYQRLIERYFEQLRRLEELQLP